MSLISIPNVFTVGAVIIASQHNSNFSTIYSDYNGNITDANISASAAISDSKLAQITTASKISGAALTSLASIPSGAGIIPTANLPSFGVTLVSTSTPSAVSSFTISSLSSATRYKLILNLLQNTSAGAQSIRFNSDSGANYAFGNIYVLAATTVSGNASNSGQSMINLTPGASTVASGSYSMYELNFQTVQGNVNKVLITGTGNSNDGTNFFGQVINGFYTGASSLTSITVLTSAGTLTGTASLYSFN